MKPQLTIQDFGGIHNGRPEETSARLIKGASWKRQRVVMIIPADALIPAKAYLAHCNLAFPPNNGMIRILAQGMEVGDAYSAAIESVLAHPDLKEWEYILTVEHDNLPPNDGVLALIEQMEAHPEYDCIGGLYFTKGEGGVAQIWGDPKDPILNFRPQIPTGGLQECCGTGMGFNLWRMKLFKDERIQKPWFRTLASKHGVGTQDLSFWAEARKHGHRCAIDCNVRVGHYDVTQDLVW